MDQFIEHFTYLGVLLILLGSGFGLPLPEDLPLALSGALCARGYANIWIMLPLCFAAVFGADCMLYLLGRRYGHHVSRLPLLRRYLTPHRLARAEATFHKHGGKTLFVARFLPGVRTPVFFTAGVFRLPFWKLVVFDGGAALLSVPAMVIAGFLFATHIHEILGWIDRGKYALVGLIALIILVVLLYRWLRRPRATSST